jgi:hypothetical protein
MPYGWHHDISDDRDLERLVAHNAERAEEARNGFNRWYVLNTAPDEVRTQQDYAGVIEPKK